MTEDQRRALDARRDSAGPAADLPRPGESYFDSVGRVLLVEVVEPRDALGREVRGWLTWSPRADMTPSRDRYSCTLAHWASRWRDGAPPTPRSAMTLA